MGKKEAGARGIFRWGWEYFLATVPGTRQNAAMTKRRGIISELASFLAKHKAYWLVPILLVAVIFAAILTLAAIVPAAAPFIYTLF